MVLHWRARGVTDGRQNFVVLTRGLVETSTELRTYPRRVTIGCIEARVRVRPANLVSDIYIRDKVSCQGNKMVIHWFLCTASRKDYIWVVDL